MKKKQKALINIISQTFFVMFCVISLGLFGTVISLGIIPLKYLIVGLAIILFIYSLIGLCIYHKRVKSVIKIFFTIICLLLTMLYLILFNYLDSTLDFMDMIKAKMFQIEYYYVLVDNESNIDSIDNVDTIGIYSANVANYDDVFKELNKKISYEKKEYTSYITLTDGLFNDEVDAVIMSASNMEAIADIVTDFKNKTKIIHTIELKIKNEVAASDIDVTKEPFNIYVSGVDVYGDINIISRSDVNMVITVNPTTHEILLTSIPRDYYVQLDGTTGLKDKLTHAGLYGVNKSIKTIENLLDIDIDYYVRVNFTTLISLVDAIGGIDVYSDKTFTPYGANYDNCYFKEGMNRLNGKCALAYSRERHAYIDGDRHRIQNQQDVIKAIANKMLSSTTLITKYNQILESMGSSFQTNIPSDSIYDLINKQLDGMPKWSIYSYSLNGSDSSNYTYSFGEQELYVMEPDMNTVQEAKEKIKMMMMN